MTLAIYGDDIKGRVDSVYITHSNETPNEYEYIGSFIINNNKYFFNNSSKHSYKQYEKGELIWIKYIRSNPNINSINSFEEIYSIEILLIILISLYTFIIYILIK